VSGDGHGHSTKTLAIDIFLRETLEKTILFKRRNILTWMNNSYIENCKFNRNQDPYCPIIQVGYILKEAEPDPIERDQILQKVI
jgi:hypothetical protein